MPDGAPDDSEQHSSSALHDLAQALLDNPVVSQALKAALGAREVATSASNQAYKNLNVAPAADLERLERRLRSISDRLEEVEDRLDELASAARRPSEPPLADSIDQPRLDEERLGLSE